MNPLHSVELVQTRGRERRVRRALTDDEVGRLLRASERHRPVYLAALLTGLRRGELKALQWGDVHLDGSCPFLSVRASTTKNNKAATIFLRDDLVAELRRIKQDSYLPSRRVFHRMIPRMAEFRDDLKRAGIAKTDAQGRRVDFHALRHTLATNLGRCGVPQRTGMEMMRHSDMRLMNGAYTDVSQLPTVEAMNKLPRWPQCSGASAPAESVKIVSQTGDVLGHFGASGGTIDGRNANGDKAISDSKNGLKSHVSKRKRTSRKNSAGRIRTYAESVKTPDNIAPSSSAQPNAQPSFARDSDLSLLLQYWNSLPEPIKLVVMALVRSSLEWKAK